MPTTIWLRDSRTQNNAISAATAMPADCSGEKAEPEGSDANAAKKPA